jgi:hypothetical protein
VDIISLFVVVILIGVVFWGIGQLGGAFNIPAPVIAVIHVFLVVFVVLYLLQSVGVSVGPVLRLR